MPSIEVFTHIASGTVSAGGSTAPAGGTVETWTVTAVTAFPAASPSAVPATQFHVCDPGATTELMLVTVAPGGIGAGQSWTVTRGADGTIPVTHSGGFTIYQVTPASWLAEVTTHMPTYQGGDFGVVGDGSTDCGALINGAMQHIYNNGGGTLLLPVGVIRTSQTLIIPTRVVLRGQGIDITIIAPVNPSVFNADTIQFETYNSASQAAILGIAAGSLLNAFYAGLSDCRIYGNFNTGTPGATFYNHVVNSTTNPLTSAAPGDPDFDPTNYIDNCELRGASGDGLFCSGRGQLRVTRCVSRYNNGNGFTPTFDTIMACNNAGFNGITGFYVNHGACDGAGNKSYNNGTNNVWTTGNNWSLGQPLQYNNLMYVCILAISNSTTIPSSDTTHFTQVTAATAPAAWGYDYYFDSNSVGNSWQSSDSQEPSAGSFYLKSCTGLQVSGTSSRPNFNQNTSSANGSNPNLYASATLDGATGCTLDVAYDTLGTVAYAARLLNSAASNNLRMTGDGTYEAILSSDTTALAGNIVSVDAAYLGTLTAADYAASGLTGATAASRYAGATTSGAPGSGTFAKGDFVIDQTGTIWVCTTAGTPGTWAALDSLPLAQTVTGQKTFTATGAGSSGAIIANDITVKPNAGISTSASIFMDNLQATDQIWEFFCDSGGKFGVFDFTAGNQIVKFDAGAVANAIHIDNASLFIGATLRIQAAAVFSDAIQYAHTGPKTGNYSINTNADYFVGTDTTAGILTITLPNLNFAGQVYVIKDETGQAAAHNVTISSAGGLLIDGAASKTLNTAYQVIRVYSTGTAWATW